MNVPPAGIGQTVRIKGDVTAREPFLIAGQVEGTVEVEEHALTSRKVKLAVAS